MSKPKRSKGTHIDGESIQKLITFLEGEEARSGDRPTWLEVNKSFRAENDTGAVLEVSYYMEDDGTIRPDISASFSDEAVFIRLSTQSVKAFSEIIKALPPH
ncbi:MAG: hypothetical protein BIFFINMI_03561 [Phycisphaerae bacterium]|nr:hypothetical protein [Phycisphaerae bacterium]